ncbi:MAG: MBL fold metallo-hydrolase [Lewinella sp.]
MLVTVVLIGMLVAAVALFIRQDQFGQSPSGERLERIRQSPNFRDGKFQNLSETPQLTGEANYVTVIYDNYFKSIPRHYPTDTVPSVKTDLRNLPPDANVLVWFGHSSYYLQIDGKRILVDPVFSGNASPIPGTTKSYAGTDIYSVADMPEIDYLFISHDHYDHVDHQTLVGLREKIGQVICGLGVGAHFERWGYKPDQIVEKDWYEQVDLDTDFTVYVEPARHFSGRALSTHNTLWASYVLQTPSLKVYIGGDSGYDAHYADIGKRHGPIDLAMLDNGQYDDAWRYLHNHPGEVLQAARDLGARRLFPVHSSKFTLAAHPWDEPYRKITELNEDFNIPLVTPMIGEVVELKDTTQVFARWWEGLN